MSRREERIIDKTQTADEPDSWNVTHSVRQRERDRQIDRQRERERQVVLAVNRLSARLSSGELVSVCVTESRWTSEPKHVKCSFSLFLCR